MRRYLAVQQVQGLSRRSSRRHIIMHVALNFSRKALHRCWRAMPEHFSISSRVGLVYETTEVVDHSKIQRGLQCVVNSFVVGVLCY